MEFAAQSNRHRFPGKKSASDATAIRGRQSDGHSVGTFSREKSERSRGGSRSGKKRSGVVGAQYSREPRRRSDTDTDRPIAAGRCFQRAGMETMVGLNQEALKKGGLLPDSSEEERTDPIARRKGFARGRAAHFL